MNVSNRSCDNWVDNLNYKMLLHKNVNPLCSHSSPQWIGEISVSGIWPWFIGGIRQDFINENILKRKRSRPFNSTFVSHQTCLNGEKSFVKLSYELFTGLHSNLWVRFYSFVSCLHQKDEFVRFLFIKIEIIQKKCDLQWRVDKQANSILKTN